MEGKHVREMAEEARMREAAKKRRDGEVWAVPGSFSGDMKREEEVLKCP